MPKTLNDMTEEEFDKMLEDMSSPEYDALTIHEFSNILSAMDVQDEIHWT